MNEDESIRAYVQRVTESLVGIRNYGGTYDEDEFIAKILRSLTPTYKFKAMSIQETIPLTPNLSREMLIAKLTAFEAVELGEVAPKVESAFRGSTQESICTSEHKKRRLERRAW